MSEIPKFDTEYIKQIWKDELVDPDGGLLQEGTPYNEIRMMYIENGISEAHAAVVALSLWLADKYAAIGHTHEGIYSPIVHDHNAMYAAIGHNHSGTYEPVFSKNSGFNLDKSDSVASTSSVILATSKAAKVAYDKGVEALGVANAAQVSANGKEPAFSKNTGFNLNKSDSVTSTSSTTLATSKAAKVAYDKGVEALGVANGKEPAFTKKSGFNLNKSDSVSSTSTSTLATSAAARTAYNKGVEALNKANSIPLVTINSRPSSGMKVGHINVLT